MNDFTNLQQMPPSITGLQLMQEVSKSPAELERLNQQTRARIICEIAMLNEDAILGNGFKYDQILKLVQELFNYGYKKEAMVAMKTLDSQISELNPSLLPWMAEQMKQFDSDLTSEKVTGIFIESHYESEGNLFVTWCYEGLEYANTVPWHTSCILMDDLIQFVKETGLYHQVDDIVDHSGNHIQKELRRDVYSYVQEEIGFLIKKYMASGKPRTEL